MKTVLKCDFCSEIMDVNKTVEMMIHEAGCSFNPANKVCWTCKHYEDHGYYGNSVPACAKKLDTFEIMDDDIPCDSHETSDRYL